MDEVIFEEFKGTGNMEVHLDRALVDRRIFPSINIERPAPARRIALPPGRIQQVVILRRALTECRQSRDGTGAQQTQENTLQYRVPLDMPSAE